MSDTPVTSGQHAVQTSDTISPLVGGGFLNNAQGNKIISSLNAALVSPAKHGIGTVPTFIKLVRFQFSSDVSGQTGVYNAKIISGANMNVSADLVDTDFGTTSPNENLIVWVRADIAAGVRTIKSSDNGYGIGVLIQADKTTGRAIAEFIDSARQFIFAVTVTSDGGSAGDATTACSFTYTVTDLDGNSLGTTMTPACARPSIGKMVAATNGSGYYDSSGNFILFWVDEVPSRAKCGSGS